MKLIISESKLTKIIDKFIDNEIGHLKKFKVPQRTSYFVWYNPINGKIILDGIFNDESREIMISESILNPLMITFDLTITEAIECFHKWISENWNIDNFNLFLDDTSYDPDLGDIEELSEI